MKELDAGNAPDPALAGSARGSHADFGEYAQSILLELRAMALQTRCTYLAYLLELALIEASDLEAGRAPSTVATQSVEGIAAPDLAEIARRILSARGEAAGGEGCAADAEG